MFKLRTVVIVVVIYIIAYLSLKFNFNILYPYYLVRDLITFPVLALNQDKNLTVDVMQLNSLINELKSDLADMKKLTGIKIVSSDYSLINATVIDRNRSYWFNTLRIDKGTKDGLSVDMAVINQEGLIGRISKVSDYTSEIKLITTNDVNSKISVVIQNGDEKVYGIANGYDSDSNELIVTLTNKNIQIKPDSVVTTTGLGGIFPSGILIGIVTNSQSDNYDVGQIALVKPYSDIKNLRYVAVLVRK